MKSLSSWRIHQLYEIAIATNPDHIILGAPTLDSVKEQLWGNSRVPPYIPNTEVNPIANGNVEDALPQFMDSRDTTPEFDSTAPSVNNGGLLNRVKFKSTFEELIKKWRDEHRAKTEFDSNKGLGDHGMGYIGSSTFNRNTVNAGESPTISRGIPVGAPAGMFGN
jgi:hypothetical protein